MPNAARLPSETPGAYVRKAPERRSAAHRTSLSRLDFFEHELVGCRLCLSVHEVKIVESESDMPAAFDTPQATANSYFDETRCFALYCQVCGKDASGCRLAFDLGKSGSARGRGREKTFLWGCHLRLPRAKQTFL